MKKQHSRLLISCQYNYTPMNDFTFSWLFLPQSETMQGFRSPRLKGNNTRTSINNFGYISVLEINDLIERDAGMYSCAISWNKGHARDIISVKVILSSNKTCEKNELRCKSGGCLPKSYWCDHVDNCPDGSDEDHCDDPCFDGFKCFNGRCIDRKLVCDRLHLNNCGDWSDEHKCEIRISAIQLISDKYQAKSNSLEAAHQMLWVSISCGCSVLICFAIAAGLWRLAMMYDLQTMAPTLTKSSIFEMLRKEDQAEEDVKKCCFEEI